MKIAIEGCCHGELSKIYAYIKKLPPNQRPELLIACGDFQAVRNKNDLQCVSMPSKYRKLGDFQDYYTGKLTAPLLTIFVGGNHEASNHLQELKFGGWVAPNIYYLGKSNVIWYKGLKIGGISGIWNDHSFMKPSWETPPYNSSSVRSVYHVRKLDYLKFLFYEQLSRGRKNIDVFVSHDWPKGIAYHGNWRQLVRFKPFFAKDIQTGKLGSPVNKMLLEKLVPRYWYCAHLHCRFDAVYKRPQRQQQQQQESPQNKGKSNKDEIDITIEDSSSEEEAEEMLKKTSSNIKTTKNKDEIEIDISDTESDSERTNDKGNDSNNMHVAQNNKTKFLALDKCLPGRKFIAIEDIEPIDYYQEQGAQGNGLYYDKLFIQVNKFFNDFVKTQEYSRISKAVLLNAGGDMNEELTLIIKAFADEIRKHEIPEVSLPIPCNFEKEVSEWEDDYSKIRPRISKQTELYCQTFDIDYNQDQV